MTGRDARVAFRRIPGRHRFIVHVSIVNRVVGIYRDGRIGALSLRMTSGHSELSPGSSCGRTKSTALRRTALIDRQPDCAVWRYMQVSMQASTGNSGIGWPTDGGEACPQSITSLASGGTDDVLRT